VMGIDKDFARTFAKAYLATGSKLPLAGKVFVSVKDSDKDALVDMCHDLLDLGFSIVATQGTQEFLQRHHMEVERVNKVRQGRPHIVDALKDGHIQFVVNTTEGVQSVKDSASIRQTSLAQNIAYCTTMAGARALIEAISCIKKEKGLEVCSLQEYHAV
jgi:carbamoyl-phosphate synthase large subunit